MLRWPGSRSAQSGYGSAAHTGGGPGGRCAPSWSSLATTAGRRRSPCSSSPPSTPSSRCGPPCNPLAAGCRAQEQDVPPACAPACSCRPAFIQARGKQVDRPLRPCSPSAHTGGAAAAVAAPLRGAGDQRADGAHRVCAQHRLHPRHQGQEPAPHLPARPLRRALWPRGERSFDPFRPPPLASKHMPCAQMLCSMGTPLLPAALCRGRRSGRQRSGPLSRAWPPTAWYPTSCRCRLAHHAG